MAPRIASPPGLVTPRTRPGLRALARGFVPEAAQLDDAGWTSFERLLDQAVRARPPAVARQLGAFLRLLGGWSRVRYGRPLGELAPPEATALLRGFAASPLLLLRRGVWGLRTLVFLGYYADEARAASLGYRAQAAGWSARQ